MIVQKDFLNKLRDFGLNSYESRLWTALLSRGVSTAGELSDIANVPRSRSYDVLESLEKKGFIIMKLGKPIKYIAVPPQEVVERVKNKIKEQATRRVSALDEIKNTKVLEELNLLHSQGIELVDPQDITGSIKGRDNIYNHIETMIKGSQKSVVLTTNFPGLVRKVDSVKKQLEKAHGRGVKIKILVADSKKPSKELPDLKNIAEIRHTDKLSGRFMIVDDKELLFMLMSDDKVHSSYDVGVWVNSPFFSKTLLNLFDNSWKDMKKL